jgi:predicted DsbA family dithiol-disulfide isomerase
MSQPGGNGGADREWVAFYLDPLCPWTWRTAIWMREVRQVRPVEIEWRFFSLDKNRGDEWADGRSGLAMRTMALARRLGGQEALERLYMALGLFERPRQPELREPAVIDAAVAAAGLPADLRERAAADASIVEEIDAEHAAAAERFKAFGVPLIVLDGGEGPYLFGPVITQVPTGEDAAEVWDRFVWLTRRPEFLEVKRPR